MKERSIKTVIIQIYNECRKPKHMDVVKKKRNDFHYYDKFFYSNLRASGKGTDSQQEDMQDYLALNAHSILRLGDILGGRRKLQPQPSNEVKDLVNSVINKTKKITDIRKEIENNPSKQ